MELTYLNAIKLLGPNLFEELLEKARRLSVIAHNAALTLTDGIINDMKQTG